MKKIWMFILIAAMMLLQLPMGVAFGEENEEINVLSDSRIGPLFTEEDIQDFKNGNSYTSQQIEIVYSWSEYEDALYENMVNRVNDLTIEYHGDTSDLGDRLNQVYDNIINRDDYVEFNLVYIEWSGSYSSTVANITYNIAYLTTNEQEDYVTNEVNRILSEIITTDMNVHQKEKAIHDYIVANIAYDTSLEEHSAYAALSKGITVCQGYSLLTYKMLNQVGIPTIIVISEAMNHSWNMVNIEDNWYHLDCTWDDPIPDVAGRVLYDYYNLTNSQIQADHDWIISDYPMADSLYVYSDEPAEIIEGDFNGDYQVDITDLINLAQQYGINFGETGFDEVMDMNGDGTIDIYDMVILARMI